MKTRAGGTNVRNNRFATLRKIDRKKNIRERHQNDLSSSVVQPAHQTIRTV
jgi:hypothetical protein